MTSSQAKLAISLLTLAVAFPIWLYSYSVFSGTGFIRTAALFGLAWLLLAPYDRLFRTVSQEIPVNQKLVSGIFAGWIFVILAGVLFAQLNGYRIPTGRGINRPLGAVVLMLPLVGVVGWRFRQMYGHLGRSGA